MENYFLLILFSYLLSASLSFWGMNYLRNRKLIKKRLTGNLLEEYQSRIIKLLSTRKVIETGMEIVNRLFETEHIDVLVWHDSLGSFSPMKMVNPSESLQFRVFDEIILWMSEQDRIFTRTDFDTEEKFRSIRKEALDFFDRTASQVFVPFNLNKNLLAILYAGRKINGLDFTEDEIIFLNEIRHITSITLSNTILYERITALNENLEEKVKERTEELEEAQGLLIHNEKMASLGVMVAGIAHEINTPSGVINGAIVNIMENLDQFIFRILGLLNSPDDIHRSENVRIQNSILEKLTSRVLTGIEKNTMNSSLRFLETKKLTQKIQLEKILPRDEAESRAKFIIDNNLMEESDAILNMDDNFFTILKNIIRLKQNLDNAGYGIKAISSIIKALKYYSHLDQSLYEPTDIRDGLENTVIILHNQLKKGIDVIRNYADLPNIEANPGELNQIWTNLINNSIHAMGHDGSIELKTEMVYAKTQPIPGSVFIGESLEKIIYPDTQGKYPYARISITDSGKGIPESIQEKIFDPFFTTKAPGEGTGLGLGIVKKIIEKHKGFIHVFSRPGSTSISVYLPYQTKNE